ncbi:MAG TPA: endonuclease III [Armatimonadota bacterium]|jgi:endonuclease-3
MPRESKAARARRVTEILARLHERYPGATTALHYTTALELLAAVILSAQATDKVINEITPALFRQYPTARAYAEADPVELEQMIRRSGFFHNKAKSLRGMGAALVANFGGEVPGTLAELITLPGVARKTANVVLANAFGRAEGVVVDTHIKRVSYRLGLTAQTDPVKVEQDLMALLPREEWIFYGESVVLHGRDTCHARKPECPVCMLREVCPRVGVAAG